MYKISNTLFLFAFFLVKCTGEKVFSCHAASEWTAGKGRALQRPKECQSLRFSGPSCRLLTLFLHSFSAAACLAPTCAWLQAGVPAWGNLLTGSASMVHLAQLTWSSSRLVSLENSMTYLSLPCVGHPCTSKSIHIQPPPASLYPYICR